MPEEQNYYEEMGVPIDATDSQIKEAYKKLAKKYHPDLNPDMPQWAATQMKKLNVMYDTLSSPVKRRIYDRKIDKAIYKTPPPSYPRSYSNQRDEARYRTQSNRKTPQTHKRFIGLSSKTIKTAALGTFISGLTAFLVLSFLPIKPPKDVQWTVIEKRPSPTTSLPQKKVDPSMAEVYYKKGMDYTNNDMYPEAIAEFEKAIKINPEHLCAHAYLGFAYDTEERLDEAIHEFEKAININPDFADAYYGLSVIYKKKGLHDKAERELEIYKWLTEGNPE
jgi:curved DNA-binding protein CbpA